MYQFLLMFHYTNVQTNKKLNDGLRKNNNMHLFSVTNMNYVNKTYKGFHFETPDAVI